MLSGIITEGFLTNGNGGCAKLALTAFNSIPRLTIASCTFSADPKLIFVNGLGSLSLKENPIFVAPSDFNPFCSMKRYRLRLSTTL